MARQVLLPQSLPGGVLFFRLGVLLIVGRRRPSALQVTRSNCPSRKMGFTAIALEEWRAAGQ